MIEPDQEARIAFFFCQRLDPGQDKNRRSLEMEFGPSVVFYPMPCGGRVETIHLLRALEGGADRVVVITCPRGQCRYGEGNLRAQKRLKYAKNLVHEIGLEPERLEFRAVPLVSASRIDEIIRPILLEPWNLGPSPLRRVPRKR